MVEILVDGRVLGLEGVYVLCCARVAAIIVIDGAGALAAITWVGCWKGRSHQYRLRYARGSSVSESAQQQVGRHSR